MGKIVDAPLDRKRIVVENRGGSRIKIAGWDNVARIGCSVQAVQLEVVGRRAVANLVYVIVIAKLGEISIPHGLVGYGFLAERLRPVPHAFLVAEEEGVVSNNRSSDGTPECVCAFGSLGDQRQGIHKSGGIEG